MGRSGSDAYAYGDTRAICFVNEKGGVGKTTSCINLAASLAKRGYEVLVADMDPQSNATLGVGIDPDEVTHPAHMLLLDRDFPLQRAIIPTEIDHLDLLPSNASLAACNHALVAAVGRELRLRNKILDYSKDTFTKKYDFLLADCSPTLDLLTVNVLMAATHLVVPVQPRFLALQGMALLGQTIQLLYDQLDPSIRLLGILVTFFENRAAMDRAVLELLAEKMKREYGDYVFHSMLLNPNFFKAYDDWDAPGRVQYVGYGYDSIVQGLDDIRRIELETAGMGQADALRVRREIIARLEPTRPLPNQALIGTAINEAVRLSIAKQSAYVAFDEQFYPQAT